MNRSRTRAVLVTAFLATAVLALAAACSSGSDTDAEPAASPDVPTETSPEIPSDVLSHVAPDHAALAPLDGLERLDGPAFDLASHPAELPTVVWFWAPWCPNCRAMAPDLADLTAEHVGRVTVVGVAGRGGVDEMHEFVADTGTEAIDHVIDDDGSTWQSFGITSQPAFVFVTTDGEVSRLSGRQSRETMAARFDALLGS